jgi:hypothetical protein
MPRKPFLLRVDDQLLAAIQRWAAADMRSLNGQIEYLLRDALRRTGRLPKAVVTDDPPLPEPEQEQE